MHKTPVYNIFVDTPCVTEVWASARAIKAIAKDSDDSNAVMKKLKMLATAGFAKYEGAENSIVRSEGDGAFRVRHRNSSLFRLIGFYECNRKAAFILLDGFKKPGQKYTQGQRDRIQNVASAKKSGAWYKEIDVGDSEETD